APSPKPEISVSSPNSRAATTTPERGRCGGSSRRTSTPKSCPSSPLASTPTPAPRSTPMTDALFSTLEVGSDALTGYRLTRLEVYNWGTFDGQVWTLQPDGRTSLLKIGRAHV